ncbi:integrase core domain-containing protein [Corynebacterium pseudodiphtheriticum]|uniref:integrase core domain-containing protein n=2 Tax=Corynebacterium pseudodiphtheriticum TaxID=37637 RepID=UPI003D6D1F1C
MGPEFISHEMTQWAAKQDTVDAFIPPGMPWRNGFGESFHKRLRDELLERRDVRLPPLMRHTDCNFGHSIIIPIILIRAWGLSRRLSTPNSGTNPRKVLKPPDLKN